MRYNSHVFILINIEEVLTLSKKKLRKLEDVIREYEKSEVVNHNPRFTAINYNILAANDLTSDAKVLALLLIDMDTYSIRLDLNTLMERMGLNKRGTKYTIEDLKIVMEEIKDKSSQFYKNFGCEYLYKEVINYAK